jgi:hypothetical protein
LGYYRRSSRIAYRSIDGEAAVVTVDDRKLHLLNEVGSFIFEAVTEPRTLEDLANGVVRTFEVSKDQAMADCQRFCEDLVKRKVLEWVP